VGACLCNNLHAVEYTVTYWLRGNYEVDFVVSRGSDIWAIEVKSGRGGKTEGLARFRTHYPEARALLVGGAGIPLEEFLSRNVRDRGSCKPVFRRRSHSAVFFAVLPPLRVQIPASVP